MRGRPAAETGVVLWDGFGLQTLHSGVGRHAWDLLQGLERAACLPSVIPSVPTIDSHFSPYVLEQKSVWPRSRIKPWALLWSSHWLRNFLRRGGGSCVVHGLSNYNLPDIRAPRVRKVLTVHDLIPILQRQEVSAALGLYLRYQLPKAIAAADAIICVSRWTEATLHEHYPESRGRTLVIPNGWAPFTPSGRSGSRQLLTISRTESYKRLGLVPEILRQLPADIRWTVVTDARGRERLQSAGDPRLEIRTGISDAEMQTLHQEAGLYVHPSLYEGFCLPAAASISQGVPVVYTRGSGIDEVVDTAGCALPASADGKSWAEAIEGLLGNPDRQSLCRIRSASALSWDDVALRTREVYGKLGGR